MTRRRCAKASPDRNGDDAADSLRLGSVWRARGHELPACKPERAASSKRLSFFDFGALL
jgi:hypothetical protein